MSLSIISRIRTSDTSASSLSLDLKDRLLRLHHAQVDYRNVAFPLAHLLREGPYSLQLYALILEQLLDPLLLLLDSVHRLLLLLLARQGQHRQSQVEQVRVVEL